MGTWGLGTFEDDVACDWLEDLGDSDPYSFFAHCLDLRDQHEVVGYVACVGVVRTAEMLIGLLAKPREGLPEAAYEWLGEHEALEVLSLVPEAVMGLRLVLATSSEMHQLWADDGQRYGQWQARIGEMIDLLLTGPGRCGAQITRAVIA